MSARLVVLLLLLAALASAAEAAPFQVKAAVHVHSSLSTGVLSLDELAQEARRKGIGALVLTENLLLRFEYGLFPFRGVVRKVVDRPSVLPMGIERYLAAVEEAQRRAPDVLLVPGVEVMPYYYWTGSPFTRDLTMWDAQKNLLVVGLTRPEDFAAIPAIGNGWRPGSSRTLTTLAAALGALAGGVYLVRHRRERQVRLAHFTVRVQKRYRLWGASALGLGALLLAEALTASDFNPYRGNLGVAPYQASIEAVAARQGMTLWSLPEARDESTQSLGAWGSVTIRTDPYPEALAQTQGYTGFGAIYPDTVTITRPGGLWDQILRDYAEGRRARPVWGFGEVAYHGPPKPLDEALTVFLVADRSRRAVLEALRTGQLYALRPLPGYHLVLDEFAIAQDAGGQPVGMGGQLTAGGQEPLRLRIRLTASDGREVAVSLKVIRSGRVVETLKAVTPIEATLPADPPGPGTREFFRLEVDLPHPLLSNPIFVARRP